MFILLSFVLTHRLVSCEWCKRVILDDSSPTIVRRLCKAAALAKNIWPCSAAIYAALQGQIFFKSMKNIDLGNHVRIRGRCLRPIPFCAWMRAVSLMFSVLILKTFAKERRTKMHVGGRPNWLAILCQFEFFYPPTFPCSIGPISYVGLSPALFGFVR